MFARSVVVIAALIAAPVTSQAQHGGGSPSTRIPPREASQFNFLVGQWELSVKPAPTTLAQKIHGIPKLTGTWKAWRALDGWGVEDELRITDASGNPLSLTHAVRVYDASAKRWKSSSVDPYRSVISTSVAEMRGEEIMTSSRGTDPEGKPYMSRGKYTKISPSTFRFIHERSTDNGKTWDTNLTIDAKRVSSSASR